MVPAITLLMTYSLKLRIASIFILFFASILGVVLPLFFSAGTDTQTNESHRKMFESDAFRIMRTFAAGVMLGVGFIHLLADGASTLSAVIDSYPALGYTLATVGTMIVLGFEQVAVMLIGSVRVIVDGDGAKSPLDADKNIESAPELEVVDVHSRQNPGSCDHNHAIRMIAGTDSLNVIIKAYMMEISVAIHSIIIGIALGSLGKEEELESLRALLIAICFHQFFEGIGLGTVIESARLHLGTAKILIFAITFAFTVPIGVMIGILITQDEVVATGDDATAIAEPDVNFRQEVALGCLNSIAAGDDEISKMGLDDLSIVSSPFNFLISYLPSKYHHYHQ